MELKVFPNSSFDSECDCCGSLTRSVTGFLYRHDGEVVAGYSVRWTPGRIESHGANFDVILGSWGDGTSSDERSVVSLELQYLDGAPNFFVIDAAANPAEKSILAACALKRTDVIGSPIAQQVFQLIDVIWNSDSRIADLVAA